MKGIIRAIINITLLLCMLGCAKSNTESDYKYIKTKGKLAIGITMFAPMNYHNTDGELVGFDTEFAQAVCKKLGLTPEFIEINWDLKETELVSKNIDCIWNGMTITEQLQKKLTISDPYMGNKQVLVSLKDKAAALADSIDGTHIAAEQGSAGEQIAMFLQKDVTYTPFDSQMKALNEVAAGTADAAIVDYVLSFGAFGESTALDNLVIVDRTIGDSELYGIAFRKDSDMVEKINKIISDMRADGSLNAIAVKYRLDKLLAY